MRTAAWQEVNERVVIERPRPKRRRLTAPLEWLGFLMSSKRIRLDPKGSLVWRLLDGGSSVQSVADRLRAEFGADIEPAEERIGLLIRQLRTQELVAYPGWDEDAQPPTPAEIEP